MKDKLIKSSYFRVLEIMVITAMSLALTPYLIDNLGGEHYGLWILLLSTLGWFNFIDLGFSFAVQRNIMLALEKSDNERINIVFSVGVVLFCLLGGIAALCVFFLAIRPDLLNVTDDSSSIASISLSILALKVFLDFVMNSFHGFYSAYLRTDIDAKLSTLNAIIKSILVFFLIVDWNIYGAVFATIFSDLITHSLKVYFAKKLHPTFKFSFKFVRLSEVRELFSFSKHLIASGIANSINRRVDPIIISHLLGLKYVALYNVVNSLINQVESLVMAVVGVFQPVFIRMVARNDDLGGVFKQVVSINHVVVLVFYTPLAILAEDFILLWIGDEYAKVAIIAYILGFAYICRTVSRPISNLLLAQANHKLLSVVNIIGAFVNISFSIWLGQIWGLEGIAIATVCGFFISDVVFHLVLLKRYTSFTIMPILLKFLLVSCLFGSFSFFGKYVLSFFSPLSWFELFFSAIVIVFLIVVFCWLCVLNREIRNKLSSMLTKKYLQH